MSALQICGIVLGAILALLLQHALVASAVAKGIELARERRKNGRGLGFDHALWVCFCVWLLLALVVFFYLTPPAPAGR